MRKEVLTRDLQGKPMLRYKHPVAFDPQSDNHELVNKLFSHLNARSETIPMTIRRSLSDGVSQFSR
jgi:hypothetical protein